MTTMNSSDKVEEPVEVDEGIIDVIVNDDDDDVNNKESSTCDDIVKAVAVSIDDTEENRTGTQIEIETIVSIKDMALYMIIGLASTVDSTYTGSASFEQLIALPEFNQAPTAFAHIIGKPTGVIFSIVYLQKIAPETLVSILFAFQFLGVVFMWTLPPVYNNIIGTIFLDFGMFGMMTSVVPLTMRSGFRASAMYMSGATFSGLIGAGWINLFDATRSGKTAHFVVLALYPLSTIFAFFGLDRSVLQLKPKPPPATTTSESVESLEEQQQQQQQEQETETETYDKKKEVSKKNNKSWLAFKEISLRYVPQIVIFNFFNQIWYSGIYMPSLVSSSLTYAGDTTIAVLDKHEDRINTIQAIVVAVVGTSLLTPLARIIPGLGPVSLWIPTIMVVVLTIIGSMGLRVGAFPPLSNEWLVSIQILFSSTTVVFAAYIQLYFREDNVTSTEYQEIQVQMNSLITLLLALVTVNINIFWFQGFIRDGCITNYEEVYDGVNCTNFVG